METQARVFPDERGHPDPSVAPLSRRLQPQSTETRGPFRVYLWHALGKPQCCDRDSLAPPDTSAVPTHGRSGKVDPRLERVGFRIARSELHAWRPAPRLARGDEGRVEVIQCAVLHDEPSRTYGMPDLLVPWHVGGTDSPSIPATSILLASHDKPLS